ncbi:(2Fe-2S) ferredoxin domain-containing protein [Gloeobacter violaceus]|uniref:Glr1974 protein n=1 Tax=Gloeobacter violaceus (strain ATCC 29082 / PCC 7421) TaxID=251221 RepID=Q7NJ58_GLOVI|nr:(Fe-S)-binding protein [Gloeobacter violaceus]BAC89915.1 glr1974 [Gloeobacter violaceus PCC 7421]
MSTAFERRVQPLGRTTYESQPSGWTHEYEDFDSRLDVVGPLLYTLFQERWREVQLGYVVEGGVFELEMPASPKLCVLYDGYLTVISESWHIHLCVAPCLGGPERKTPPELSERRQLSRAAFYRFVDPGGEPKGWGIQFWNGWGEKLMSIFLPNPYLGEDDDLLPEGKARFEKLGLYDELRAIYVLGTRPIPFEDNPLTRPYLAVCTSSRCNPSRRWQPVAEALRAALAEAGSPVAVIEAPCLQVCKLGPVVYHSGDDTWYTRVTPAVAGRIVQEHLGRGQTLAEHRYPCVQHVDHHSKEQL